MNDAHWASDFVRCMENELDLTRQSSEYTLDLKAMVELIPEQIRQLDDHNHRISWLIHGLSGTTAFAIGTFKFGNFEDDGSEAFFTPPTLSVALGTLGVEYAYSQVALAIVPTEVKLLPRHLIWLHNWTEQRGNIRRMIVYRDGRTPDVDIRLAEEIVRNILSPWQTLKRIDIE